MCHEKVKKSPTCILISPTVFQLWAEMSLMAGEPVEEKYRKAFENLLEVVASKTSCSNGECIYE